MDVTILFLFVYWFRAISALNSSTKVTFGLTEPLRNASVWNSSTDTSKVQVPLDNSETQFVIPSLLETKEDCMDIRRPTWLPIATGNQRFETVFVSPDQILNWDLELNWFHRYPRPTVFDSRLNLIVEFPDTKDLGCAYNWTNFENTIENEHLFNAGRHQENINVTALVFPVEEIIDTEFARRMSSKFTIGCSIWLQENMTNVTEVVNACKNINGRLYILKFQLEVTAMEHSNSTTKNAIIQRLEIVHTFRDALLAHQSESTVYFLVEFKAAQGFFVEGYNYLCSKSAVSVGSSTDVILRWAQFQSFPVVLRPFFDSQKSPRIDFSRRWIMFLRQLSYPLDVPLDFKNISLWHGNSKSLVFRKQFVHSNVSAETCINPQKLVVEALKGSSLNFFHNENIGAIFYSDDSKFSNVKTVEEYATMLQFIFHKFHMVEIIVGHNFELLLNAIELVIKLQPDIKTVIYMQYNLLVMDISDLSTLLDAIQKSQIFQKTNLFKGIHIDVSAIHYIPAVNSKEITGLPFAKSVLKTLEIAQTWKIPVGIFLNSRTTCRNVIDSWILGAVREDIGWSILLRASYIVCAEDLQSNVLDGYAMDNHLYISRLMGKFLPNLRMQFRIQHRIIAAADKVDNDKRLTMQLYLYLLSIFKSFGSTNNISYFIVNAFGESDNRQGWWEINNHSDLTNPKTYVEREPENFGRKMWYPTPISKLVSNSTHSPISHGNSMLVVIMASVGSIFLLVFAALGLIFFVRYRKLRQFLSDSEIKEFINGRARVPNDDVMATGNIEYTKFNPEHNLNLSDVCIDAQNVLGSGAFGTVFKGIVKGDPAAIKQPNENCSKATFKSVLIEVKVLSYIGEHENVVRFLGAYTKEIHRGLIHIATELCSNGSLQSFLRKKSNVISPEQAGENFPKENYLYYQDLNMFATQISNGMEYIASKHVVHGDLATRNVLLDEHLTCKIGDFGLSRKLYEYQKYVKTSQEPLPWKWMAYESLVKMEFTSKSDVWSLGVTLWEIYSLGKVPFSGLNWTPGFTDELQSGLRLTGPQFASDKIFSKLQECWSLDPDQRPTFVDLSLFFRELCDSQYTTL